MLMLLLYHLIWFGCLVNSFKGRLGENNFIRLTRSKVKILCLHLSLLVFLKEYILGNIGMADANIELP